MVFRKKQVPVDPYRIEWVPITVAELEVYGRVLVAADTARLAARPDLGNLAHATEYTGRLYQRVGAAAARTSDQASVQVPLQKAEIYDLERAVKDLEYYQGPRDLANSGRNLVWLLQARLGRERAVIHAGGVPMFDGLDPEPIVSAAELPPG